MVKKRKDKRTESKEKRTESKEKRAEQIKDYFTDLNKDREKQNRVCEIPNYAEIIANHRRLRKLQAIEAGLPVPDWMLA